MVYETEGLLSQDFHSNDHEQQEEDHAISTLHEHTNGEDCKKKHGLVCRILTALHLKRRSHEHEKLLSESQERLATKSASTKKTKKEKVKHKKEKAVKNTSESKKETSLLPSISPVKKSNSNNNNAKDFASAYEILDNESQCSDAEFLVDTEFWEMPLVDTEESGFPATIDVTVHVYSDEHFGESFFERPQDKYAPLDEKPRTESQNAEEYLKHQWHGKRAKKARKRIRRAMRATWRSLQSGIGSQTAFLNPQGAVATAIIKPSRGR